MSISNLIYGIYKIAYIQQLDIFTECKFSVKYRAFCFKIRKSKNILLNK